MIPPHPPTIIRPANALTIAAESDLLDVGLIQIEGISMYREYKIYVSVLLVVISLVVTLEFAGAQSSVQCKFLTPTITGSGQIVGTAGNDIILGSAADDTILGGAGNDIICGAGGADYIDGGAGNDFLSGESVNGSDFDGVPGADTLLGGSGDDRLDEPSGEGDILDGGSGNDSLVGESNLHGGSGSDSLTLVNGNQDDPFPVVDGGSGRDRCTSVAFAFIDPIFTSCETISEP